LDQEEEKKVDGFWKGVEAANGLTRVGLRLQTSSEIQKPIFAEA